MSDTTISFDADTAKAEAKLKALKRSAERTGQSFGAAQAGALAGRFGGPAGGVASRFLGGGALGMGMAAAGFGVNAFLAADERRVQMAREAAARQSSRDATARSVLEKTDARAAGGVSQAGSAMRMIALGTDKSRRKTALATGSKYGLTTEQTYAAMEAARRSGVSELDIMLGVGLAGDTPEQVAQNILANNGLQNAIASSMQLTGDEASAALDRRLTDPRARNVARATSGRNVVAESQMDDLTSGRTADAIKRDVWAEMNPAAVAMGEASVKAQETLSALQAAASAQGLVAGALAEVGRLLGISQGSASRQLAEGATAVAE